MYRATWMGHLYITAGKAQVSCGKWSNPNKQEGTAAHQRRQKRKAETVHFW